MATTIGRVEYEAGLDGSKLPRQARQIGRQLGGELGKAFDAEFGKTMSKLGQELARDMRQNGELTGRSFTDAMQEAINGRLNKMVGDVADAFSNNSRLREYVDELGGVEDGSMKLRDQLKELVSTGQITDKMFYRLTGTLAQQQGQWREQVRLQKEATDENDRLVASLDRLVAAQHEEALQARFAADEHDRLQKELKETRDAQARFDAVLGNDRYRKAYINWAGDASAASRILRGDLDRMFERGEVDADTFSSKLGLLSIKLNEFGDSAKEADRDQTSLWKSLSFNARQAIVIVAAVAAGAPEIAALGSLVGSSLTVMASALTSFGIGAGVAIAGFKDLGENLEDLPEEIRPAREAWQNFTDGLGSLQDVISANLLPQLAEPFQRLADILPTLEGPFANIAQAVGEVTSALIDTITEAENLKNLQGFLDSTARVFESLGKAAIAFGEGIGEVFVIAEPFVERFVGKLQEIGEAFLEWTESDEGREAITEWFQNMETMGGPLLDLVGALGETLANVVTPEVVQMTADFLTNLAESMPFFESLIGFFAQADLFGLVAQVFNDIGNALVPVIELLSPLIDMLSTMAGVTLQMLGAALTIVTPLLWPFQVAFEIINTVFQKFMEYAQPIIDAIAEIGVVVQDQLQTALDDVMPSIEGVIDDLIAMLPPQEDIVAFIQNEMIPWIQNELGPLLEKWSEWIVDVAESVRDDLIPWIVNKLVPFIQNKLLPAIDDAITLFSTMWGIVEDVAGAIGTLVGGILDLADAIFGLPSMPNMNPGNLGTGGGMASGGIVTSGARRLIGEAGPEAVVPLDRNLSQVSPDVRWLSAIAQGLDAGSGAPAGPGTYIAPGAIVVTTAGNAMQAAEMVFDRLVAATET